MGFEYQKLASGKFQMPAGWEVTTIADVACINELAITKRTAPEQIEYIDIASVDKGRLMAVQELPFEKAPSRARRVVRSKDSLISTVRPNLEHYLFVKEAKPNTIASTGFAVVSAKSVEPRFLYYYLTSKPFTAYLTRIAESHTSAYPAFNPDVIENAELLLPTDPEQRAIAHILGSLDDKIELNRKMNETLEAIARTLFESWFVRFDPVRRNMARKKCGQPSPPSPLPEGEGSVEELDRLFPDGFEDSELGPIPKGWTIAKVEDIAEKVACGPFGSSIKVSTFVSEGIPVISGQHLNGIRLFDGKYNFITLEHAEKLKNANVFRGDVIFTHAGNIGQVAFIPETSKYDRYVLSQRQFYLRCDHEKVSPFFMAHYFRSPGGQHTLLANTSSTGVPSISRPVSYLKSIKFILPPKETINRFDDYVKPLHLLAAKLEAESQTLAILRDTLLPKLISGELRLPAAALELAAQAGVPDAEKFIEEAGV